MMASINWLRNQNAPFQGAEIFRVRPKRMLPESTFSDSGRDAWTIVHGFDQLFLHTHNSSMDGAMELKFAPLGSS